MEEFSLSCEDYFKIYKIGAKQAFASDEVKQHVVTFAD